MPMAGEGRRVQVSDHIYRFKPFVFARGRPLFEWALESLKSFNVEKLVWAVRKEHLIEFPVLEVADSWGAEVVVIHGATRGPFETAQLAVRQSGVSGTGAVLDCDLYFECSEFRGVSAANGCEDGALITFHGHSDNFSYVRARGGFALKVAEKERISDRAILGCYLLRNLEGMMDVSCEDLESWRGEFFMSHYYNYMIDQGMKIRIIESKRHQSLGTLEEIDRWEQTERDE